MDVKAMQKLGYAVNTIMLSTVVLFLLFFVQMKATFLIYFSFPVIAVYLITYLLIYKEKLNTYLWVCYAGLIIYTGITALYLGPAYCFHLYCFSMIPCVYTIEYLAFRIGKKSVKSFHISIIVAIYYFIFMLFVYKNGPIYDCGNQYAAFFMVFNSMTVFSYLVFYTNYLIRSIISSEKKLSDMAHKDKLTGLYNRHYMLDKLDNLAENMSYSLAIADIDDFKKINDTYGHNAGDEVLKTVSSKMQEICEDGIVARWGGEEFLILLPQEIQKAAVTLEDIRKAIGTEPVSFEGRTIPVTLTIGASSKRTDISVDEWIQQIDAKLYTGKKTGKNRVVL